MRTIHVDDHKDGGTFLRNIALGLIVCLVFLTMPRLCGAHSHDNSDHHGHSHDIPPSYKYSRQANEDILKKEAAAHNHHGHAHAGHDHDNAQHNHDAHHQDHKHKDDKKPVELGNVLKLIFFHEIIRLITFALQT